MLHDYDDFSTYNDKNDIEDDPVKNSEPEPAFDDMYIVHKPNCQPLVFLSLTGFDDWVIAWTTGQLDKQVKRINEMLEQNVFASDDVQTLLQKELQQKNQQRAALMAWSPDDGKEPLQYAIDLGLKWVMDIIVTHYDSTHIADDNSDFEPI